MSHPSNSSTTSPSPYVTRAGRISKSPSLYINDTSLTNKPALSVNVVTTVSNRNVTNRLETADDDINVPDEAEEDLETDKDKDDESSGRLHSSPSHGGMVYGDSSSDDSSESSCGHCWGCDRPGPKGLFCTADGCEDSNYIYQ